MAEGLVNKYLKKKWKAFSAGTQPADGVHPLAVKAMAEMGIDISGYKSKPVSKFRKKRFDVVIIVCDSAAEECPAWLGSGDVVHISFLDPAETTGTEEEKMQVFRAVRDDIHRHIFYYLSNGRVLEPGVTTPSLQK